MAFTAGDRLGHYEITTLIGKGGMGEVYKARDPRVGRDVAIKVSAQQFSERFDREARAIAALNHPNICTLYDVGPNYLVMEFVEGGPPRGPMPVDETLHIAEQIAAALEAAHEKGITHRDLKPGNVMVKADGLVKVLDFGLAKVAEHTGESDATMTLGATQPGAVMGTPAYMAPEQARGKPADRRADIWAFGVVLHELLSGRRLFHGEDLTEVLASVVKDAPDLNVVPQRMRRLLDACLQKDPKKRLQSIADWRLLVDSETEAAAAVRGSGSRTGWLVAAALAVIAGIALWGPWRTAPAPPEQIRFEISPPPKAAFTNWMTLSPDGKTVGFTARGEDGQVRLWLRQVGSLEARPLTATATFPVPFWSPDSRSIAYQIGGKLRRIDAAGGPSQVICDAPGIFHGGAWNADGIIVFGGADGLKRVPASGGTPVPLTALDATRQETVHGMPVFLPDGKRFLYLRRSTIAENMGVYAGSLDDSPDRPPSKMLLQTQWNAFLVPSRNGSQDLLVFKRENTLLAQPFDPETLELSGTAVPVASPVGVMSGRFTNAGISATGGMLAFKATGLADQRVLTWYDRRGIVISTASSPAQWLSPALSPDGTRVAVVQDGLGNRDIHLLDLQRQLLTRLTFDPLEDNVPVWSPDGSRVVFSSVRSGKMNLYWKLANGARDEELLLDTPEQKFALDWSRDGKYLLFSSDDPKTHEDIWYLPMTPEKSGEMPKPVRFLGTQFRETAAKFSPDGRFVAYISDESGTNEVYVRTFPDGNGRWQLSSASAGSNPHWRRDGRELFFGVSGVEVYAVDVTPGAAFQAGVPRRLFNQTFAGLEVSPDGQRFLLATTTQEAENDPIIVVTNPFR